jgi:hypothetical protein
MRTPGIPLGSKALYALLCSYADDDGCCHPSNETLAADLGVSESSVARGLRTLADWKLIVREDRFVENRQTTSVTRITDLDVAEMTTRPVTDDTPEGGMGDNPGGVTGDNQNNTTMNGTSTNTPSPAGDEGSQDGLSSEDELFEDFWTHYPRKVSKKDARAAFAKALKAVDYLTIRAGLVGAIKAWRAEGKVVVEKVGDDLKVKAEVGELGKGIPHAATWLNGERWNDEHPEAKVAAGQNGEDENAWMTRRAD